MKKFLILLLPFLLFSLSVRSQIEQPLRYEFDATEISNFKVIELGSEGVLVYFIKEKTKTDILWHFVKLNTSFEIDWEKSKTIDRKSVYNDYVYVKGKAYFSFFNYKADRIEILEIDQRRGSLRTIQAPMVKEIRKYHEFTATGEYAYVSGTGKHKSTIQRISLKGENKVTLSVLEVGDMDTSVDRFNFNEDSTSVFAMVKVFDKTGRRYLVREFPDNSNTFTDLYVDSKEADFSVVSARQNVLGNGEKVIIGAYGRGDNPRGAQGMFMAKYDNSGKNIFMKYYSFSEFENFFGYLSERRQEKIDKKLDKKKAKGEDLKLNYLLLTHDLMEQDGEYIVLAEAFYPQYHTESYTSTNAQGQSVTSYRTVFDGWRYTHAVVAGFDEDGNKKWDNVFEMWDVLTFSLKERVFVKQDKSKIDLLYSFGRTIKTKTISGNAVKDGKEFENIDTANEDDKVRGSTSESFYWYDDYFMAWGYQRIKGDDKRKVFYLNKINFR